MWFLVENIDNIDVIVVIFDVNVKFFFLFLSFVINFFNIFLVGFLDFE